MPQARSSAARPVARNAPAGRSPRSSPARAGAGFQPRHVSSRAPLSRIRWDRASRVALVATLALIAYLWISGIVAVIGAHAQAARGLSEVRGLAAEQRALVAQEHSLRQRSTILAQARSLGMIDQGEQAYIVTH